MTDNKELLVEIKDQIATLSINRPGKKNSLSLNILQALEAFFKNPPPEVRIAVLRGVGDEAFSSGFDIIPTGSNLLFLAI